MALQFSDEQRAVVVGQIAIAFEMAAGYRRTTNTKIAAAGEVFGQMGYGMLTLVAALCDASELRAVREAVQTRLDVPLDTFRVPAFDALAAGDIPVEELAKLTLAGFEGDPRKVLGLDSQGD